MERLAEKSDRRRGCPTCSGIDPKSCMRCLGKTFMRDWWLTKTGWQWGNFKQDNRHE